MTDTTSTNEERHTFCEWLNVMKPTIYSDFKKWYLQSEISLFPSHQGKYLAPDITLLGPEFYR